MKYLLSRNFSKLNSYTSILYENTDEIFETKTTKQSITLKTA